MDSSVAVKNDENKPRFDLIPPMPWSEVAGVFTMGAAKYEPHNWEKGLDWSRLYAAAHRHLNAFWQGDDLDEESGRSHLAHAIANLLMLLEYDKTHPELDDRTKPVDKEAKGETTYACCL